MKCGLDILPELTLTPTICSLQTGKKEYLKQDVQDYKTEFKLRSEYDVSFLILLGL